MDFKLSTRRVDSVLILDLAGKITAGEALTLFRQTIRDEVAMGRNRMGNLFPGGVLQFYDVLANGYWHARSWAYMGRSYVRLIEWCRLPGDLVFIFLGVAPMVIAAALTYWIITRECKPG